MINIVEIDQMLVQNKSYSMSVDDDSAAIVEVSMITFTENELLEIKEL